MSLNVAVQMDPIQSINIKGDSTFAMMLEAQQRGHTLFYYQTRTLALASGILSATGHAIRVRDELPNYFTLGEEERVSLSEFDVVLMRQDPPFDMGYITATHMLDHIHPTTLVVNDPTEVRNAPEKLFVLNYKEFMPPTLVTRDASELAAFRMEHEDIILKPLYGNGGAGRFPHPRHRPEFFIAARALRPHLSAPALHGAEISARCAERRQAHHPGGREICRRHQPGARRP